MSQQNHRRQGAYDRRKEIVATQNNRRMATAQRRAGVGARQHAAPAAAARILPDAVYARRRADCEARRTLTKPEEKGPAVNRHAVGSEAYAAALYAKRALRE